MTEVYITANFTITPKELRGELYSGSNAMKKPTKKEQRADDLKHYRENVRNSMWSNMYDAIIGTIDTIRPALTQEQVLHLFVPAELRGPLGTIKDYFSLMPEATMVIDDKGKFTVAMANMILPKYGRFVPGADCDVLTAFRKHVDDVIYWRIAGEEMSYILRTLIPEYGYANTLKILPELEVFGKKKFIEDEPKPIPAFKMPVLEPGMRKLCRKARLDITSMIMLEPEKHNHRIQRPWYVSVDVDWTYVPYPDVEDNGS